MQGKGLAVAGGSPRVMVQRPLNTKSRDKNRLDAPKEGGPLASQTNQSREDFRTIGHVNPEGAHHSPGFPRRISANCNQSSPATFSGSSARRLEPSLVRISNSRSSLETLSPTAVSIFKSDVACPSPFEFA
ncbi:hypothetical protein EVAR_75633_1 [Eumeta japonica]|uniref:Uncharacterized protein n=1 Tax=Eumeta variegata TaxID=151549 RepID=A0A4C1TZZ4_EUMVA|nr:hypothetical protein EVAR_75633_1 [Eumeta japonica]